MKPHRNMEAIFIVAVALGLGASYATAGSRPVEMVVSSEPEIEVGHVVVVHVTAPRLAPR